METPYFTPTVIAPLLCQSCFGNPSSPLSYFYLESPPLAHFCTIGEREGASWSTEQPSRITATGFTNLHIGGNTNIEISFISYFFYFMHVFRLVDIPVSSFYLPLIELLLRSPFSLVGAHSHKLGVKP